MIPNPIVQGYGNHQDPGESYLHREGGGQRDSLPGQVAFLSITTSVPRGARHRLHCREGNRGIFTPFWARFDQSTQSNRPALALLGTWAFKVATFQGWELSPSRSGRGVWISGLLLGMLLIITHFCPRLLGLTLAPTFATCTTAPSFRPQIQVHVRALEGA